MKKYYKIVYTYFSRGLMEEQEMTLDGLSLSDALAYVRQMAYLYCYEEFAIRQVYAETENGTAWTEVQDWAEIELQAEKARRDAETVAGLEAADPDRLAAALASLQKMRQKP